MFFEEKFCFLFMIFRLKQFVFFVLQTGLKNRQLDTVDFYLKSKENVLNPPATAFSCADQPAASTLDLTHGAHTPHYHAEITIHEACKQHGDTFGCYHIKKF